jgi:hypothetical protein
MKFSISNSVMSTFVSFATLVLLLGSHMTTASSRLGQKSKKTIDTMRSLTQVALSDVASGLAAQGLLDPSAAVRQQHEEASSSSSSRRSPLGL